MAKEIIFKSKLPNEIDDRVGKIQTRLEQLKPEFEAMADELGEIGWNLEDKYGKDLWRCSNNRLQDKKSEFERSLWLSDWLKNFRINPQD